MSESLKRTIRRAKIDLAVFTLVISLLMLATPIYLLQVYDRVLASASVDTLLFLSVITLAALVAQGVLDEIRARYADRLALLIERDAAAPAFRAALRGPGAAAGDVGTLRDLATIRSFLTSRIAFAFFDLPFTLFFLAILFLIHPLLCVIAVAGALALAAIAWLNRRATAEPGLEAHRTNQTALVVAQAFMRNQETVKALGMQSAAEQAWGRHFGEAALAANRVANVNSRLGGLARTLRQILQSAMLGAGAWLVLRHEMTAGMIFASSIISGRALMPIDQIINGWRPIIDATGAWSRLKSALESEAARDAGNATRLPAPTGQITAENLVYVAPGTRPGGPPLIKRLNFRVEAGESVAVIGPSRAGKSTLLRLLVGAIAPNSGAVRYDGADIATWPGDDLGRSIGYMAQEVEMFAGTIAENIARFSAGATSGSVVEAAQRAGVHEIVLSKPEGYDTRIGPNGHGLSGGERQRIALARAFHGAPKILVLDEPNANLDQEGEAALEQALARAKSDGVTVLIVTHKPSIAARCDRIIVLRDGQIDLSGPAPDVLARLSAARPAAPVAAQARPPSPGQPGARFVPNLVVRAGESE